MQVGIRIALLAVQFAVAGFYALAAVFMWGALIEGAAPAKVILATILLSPMLALVMLLSGVRFRWLALLTAAQLIVGMAFVMTLTCAVCEVASS